MLDKINEYLEQPIAQKFLFFNEMLTPKLIRLAYWLCLLGVLWNGLGKMFSGGFANFIHGIVFIAIGAILARVGSEIVILFFKLNENMEQVAANTKAPAAKIKAPAAISPPATAKKVAKKVSKKVTKKS